MEITRARLMNSFVKIALKGELFCKGAASGGCVRNRISIPLKASGQDLRPGGASENSPALLAPGNVNH